MGYTEAIYDFPTCNHARQLGRENIGYCQGIFDDGVPFEAELWDGKNGLYLGIIIPDILPEREVPKKPKTNESEGANIVGISYNDGVVFDAGVLKIGMERTGVEDGYDIPIYLVEYFEKNGVVEFTTNLENGFIEYLTDIAGKPLIRTIITLEEDGEILAEHDLDFKPFVEGHRKPYLRLVREETL